MMYPQRKKVAMPCFDLHIVEMPTDTRLVRKSIESYRTVSNADILKTLKSLENVPNVHTIQVFQTTVTNSRRSFMNTRVKPILMFRGNY